MRVWLCKYGETIPVSQNDRKYRVGMIGESLIENNHEVVWWASDFDHGKKIKVELPDKTYKGIKLNKLSGREYNKNISVKRILHNREIGQDFLYKSNLEEIPHLIYTSMPTIDMAYQATIYALKNNIKLIVDIRDLWPDVFKTLIPLKILRKDFLFYSMNKKLRYILNNADLVIAPTQAYLDWAKLKKGVEIKNTSVVPFGYQRNMDFNLIDFEEARNNSFEVTFAGTVSVNFDLETVMKAAELLANEDIIFNILGSGDTEKYLKNKYGKLKNVKFWGWCDANQLHKVLSKSSIGIAPYYNHDNFIYNIPNKPYEYMAYGLMTLTCLQGATLQMLEENKAGLYYKQGDPRDLADKILNYKANSLKKILAEEIISTFEKKFDAHIVYNKLITEMEALVKQT